MKKNILTLLFASTISICISQNIILHEDFSDCYNTIAIDKDNDVLALGTGLSSGGKLLLRTADGTKIDIEEMNTNIGFQSVSAMYMSDSDLYVAGFGAVAIIDTEEISSAQMFTNNNSELNYSNEFSSIVYDYNLDKIFAGNPTVGTDVYADGAWSRDDNYKKITASTFSEDYSINILVSSNGEIYVSELDDKEEFFLLNDAIEGYPTLSYSDASFGYVEENEVLSSLYLIVSEDGFMVIDGDGNFNHLTPENSDLFGGDTNCIQAGNSDGSVWLGHNGGLTKYQDGIFTFYNLLDELGGPTDILDIVIDNNDHLWLATCGGLVEFWEEPNAIVDEDLQDFSIYPTINNGSFTIIGDRSEVVNIYNLDGQKVNSINIKTGENNFNLDLDNGIYLVTNQLGISKKIVVVD